MRIAGAVLLLSCGLAGCNQILGLDRTHVRDDGGSGDGDAAIDAILADAPPCATALDHDEDGDGVDDGCDVCPQIPDPAQADSDGDHIGDLCDPDPADNGDHLVFFDSFAVPNSWAPVNGTWEVQPDALAELDTAVPNATATRSIPDPTAVELTVDVVFTIDDVLAKQAAEQTAYRGIGVWFIASGFGQMVQPSGYLCQVLDDIAAITPSSQAALYAVKDSSSIVVLGVDVFGAHVPLKTSGRIRVRRSAAADAEACHVALGSIVGDLGSPDRTYTTGTIGVRTQQSAIHVTSVTAYGR